MKKILSGFLSFIFIFSLSACTPLNGAVASEAPEISTASETPPASTPEETRPTVTDDIKAQDMCILAYFDALKTNNADKIIQISSCRLVGESIEMRTGSEFLGELYSMSSIFSTLKNTWYFIYSILSGFEPGSASPDYSKETIDQFIREVDPARLAELEVLELGTLREPLELPSNMQADSSAFSQRVCLFSFNGQTLYQIFWLANSPDGYKLVAIGDYGDINIRSFAQPVSQDEFETLIDPQTIDEPSQEMLAASTEIGSETTYLQKFNETASPTLQDEKEAITFFADSVAGGDAYAALSAFGISESVSNSDIYKLSEYVRAFMPYNLNLMVCDYDFYQDINLALKCSEKAADIIALMVGFSFDYYSAPTTDQLFSAIQKSCAVLDSMSVERCGSIVKSITQGRELSLRQAAVYGADDLQHWIIEYNFNGTQYTGGVKVIYYDGNWRIWELNSVYLDLAASITVVPSDQIDYDSYI